MTDLRTAAQQALEALEAFMHDSPRPYDAMRGQAAMEAIRAALADPVPIIESQITADKEQLQRKPLTDAEIADLWHQTAGFHHHFTRAIEAAHGIGGKK